MFGRAATFFFGVGFWGQPLFKMGAEKFVELVPNWKDYLDALDMRKYVYPSPKGSQDSNTRS